MTSAALSQPMTLSDILREPRPASSIAGYLDGLDPADRILAVRSLSGRELKRLWDSSIDSEPLTMEEFIPASTPEGKTLVYKGKNSLPVFSIFEKRFTRFGGQVIGHNQGLT